MSMINLSKYSILFFKLLIVLSFFSSVEANTNEDVTLDDILGLAYQASIEAVSYTHLTLPTSSRV